MSIAITIKKIQRNLNDFGFQGVLTKGVQYVLKPFYVNRIFRVYRRDLNTGTFPTDAPEGISIRTISGDDRGVLSQIENMEEWLKGQLAQIMSHGLCIAAFDDARVVGFNLVAFDKVHVSLLNLDIRLQPKHAWSEQITVVKEHRKQGLASMLRYHMFAELQKRGIRKLYGGTLNTNIPSQRTASKVGFTFIADVTYVKRLNRERRIWRRVKNAAR